MIIVGSKLQESIYGLPSINDEMRKIVNWSLPPFKFNIKEERTRWVKRNKVFCGDCYDPMYGVIMTLDICIGVKLC